jgi:hypothetical protein
MVCFRYIIVNTLHKGDNKGNDDGNNNNNNNNNTAGLLLLLLMMMMMISIQFMFINVLSQQ